MKGLISGIKRMEIHDGDGIRTTVFLKGCPLKCVWCHNPESISFERQTAFFVEKCIKCGTCKGIVNEETEKTCPTEAIVTFGQEYDVHTLADELSEDMDFYENSGGGVTLSGGECLMQPDFVLDLSKQLRKRGISVYIDTCGFVKRETLEAIIPYADKFLYDIKAIDEKVHKKCTGQSNSIILDNIKYLSDKGCKIEVRYPLVVGYNDDQVNKIGEFLSKLKGITKVKVLKYHNFAGSRYDALIMENTLPKPITTDGDVRAVVDTLKSYGLNAEY